MQDNAHNLLMNMVSSVYTCKNILFVSIFQLLSAFLLELFAVHFLNFNHKTTTSVCLSQF